MPLTEERSVDGTAVRWLRNGNRRCVLAFSSFALRDYGPEAFSFRKYFEAHSASVDLVLIKDVGNQWYNRELDGLGESPDATAIKLAGILGEYDSVSSFGSSMGAYASMLYGRRLGLDYILALSPQTFLSAPFPRFNPARHRGSFEDLRKTLVKDESPKWGCMDVVVGEESLFDLYQIVPLIGRPGISIHTVPDRYHVVADYWSEIGLFPSVIESLCKGTAGEMMRELSARYSNASRIHSKLQSRQFSSLLTSTVEAYYGDQIEIAIDGLKGLLSEVPGWLGATAMLADAELKAGNDAAAIDHYALVEASSKSIDDFYPEYAAALARSGQTRRAMEVAARGASLNRAMRRGFGLIAKIFDGQGLADEAAECRRRELQ